MGNYSWQLSVNRAEFAQGLKVVSRAGRSMRHADATLTFSQNQLYVDLAGTVAQVPATGDWPTEVRIPGQYLETLRKALPEDDPLPLRVDGERLFLGRFGVPCEWSIQSRPASTPVREMVPANSDLFDVLAMVARCSKEEIDAAGASGLVSNAQARLDKLCDKAAGFLTAYGVLPLQLRRLCEGHAAEGDRRFRETEAKEIRRIADAWCLLAPMGVEPLEIKALMDQCLRNAWTNPK